MEERIEALEEQVQHLGDRIWWLIQLADYERHPFTYLALETDLTKSQVDAIFELMEEARESLIGDTSMHHAAFERRVYEIVPAKRGDYHFAESIVRTLNETDQFHDVYVHMKKSGMNI